VALDIGKWNPFRFARQGGSARQDGAGSATAEWSDPARLLQSLDPFGLLPGLLRSPLPGGAGAARWFGDFTPSLFQPRIDVVDEGEALRITAELPGMERKDLEILTEDGFLVLRGEKRQEANEREKGCYRLERAFGGFQRVLPLPEDVDVQRAEATFANGVLTLRLPKRENAAADSSRRIEIK
jgi:HSP20 family protein